MVINPCDDLGFVCDENVFSCCLGAGKITFYFVILLCTISLLMGNFYVDDKYAFKKE